MNQPKLYILATPLGNSEDVTIRALNAMRTITRFCAEDTREFRKLLNILDIRSEDKIVVSYGDHNEERAIERAIEWLESGKDVGFVSDRGTPGISDPGARLVDAAWEKGYSVVPFPGPSAVTCLFSIAGLKKGRFVFLGFLPDQNSERKDWAKKMRSLGLPFCLYESPRRVRETLSWLADEFPQGTVVTGREMTKFYEEYRRLPLSKVMEHEWVELGEYSLFVDPGEDLEVEKTSKEKFEAELELRLKSDKDWARSVSERTGLSTTEIYNALQKSKADRT